MPTRKPIKPKDKQLVFLKTGGRCHFCGEKLEFGARRGEKGEWNVDHVVQLAQSGVDNIENYLPICRVCNRLRWHFASNKIRELFRYGVIVLGEIRKQTELGKKIEDLYKKKLEDNKLRRRGKFDDQYFS